MSENASITGKPATGTLAVITGSFTGSLAGVSATASYVNPLTQSLLVSGSSTYTFTSGDGLTLNRDGAGNYIQPITQPLVLYSPNSTIYQYINNSGIGVNTVPSARFHVRGSGTTSSTTSFLVENSAATARLTILDDGTSAFNTNNLYISSSGNIGIGTTTPSFKLDVSGNIRILQNSIYMDSSGDPTIFGRNNVGSEQSRIIVRSQSHGGMELGTRTGYLSFQAGPGAYTERMRITNSGLIGIGTTAPSASLHVVGNTILSGSTGTGSALTVYKSGSTVVSIQGSQGELFSITDSLSGSLFSVSNISGLPILEVFSDNTTLIGNYLDPMLVTTQLVTATSGSTTIYSLPTASYDGAFYDYVVRSGSNSRAGQIMAIWSGSSVNYTDNSTTDFGSTANLSFNVIVSGSNMVLRSTVTTGSWTVKTIIRSI